MKIENSRLLWLYQFFVQKKVSYIIWIGLGHLRAEQHIAVGEGGLYSALLGKEKEEGAEQSQDILCSARKRKRRRRIVQKSPRMDHVGVSHTGSPPPVPRDP